MALLAFQRAGADATSGDANKTRCWVQWRAHVRNAYMRRSDVRNESPTCACYMLVQQRVCASRPTHGTNIAAGDETPARAIGICGNEQRSGRRTALNIDGSRSASHSTRREPIDMKRLASKPSPHVLAQAVALDLWQHGSERRPLRSSSSGSTAASDGCSEPHAVISYHCLMHPTRSTTSMWLASASRQVLAHIFAAALMRHVVLVTRLEHDDAASRLMGEASARSVSGSIRSLQCSSMPWPPRFSVVPPEGAEGPRRPPRDGSIPNREH